MVIDNSPLHNERLLVHQTGRMNVDHVEVRFPVIVAIVEGETTTIQLTSQFLVKTGITR